MAEFRFAVFVCALLVSGCGMFRLLDDSIHTVDIIRTGPDVKITPTIQSLNVIGPLSLGVVIGAAAFTFIKYYESRKGRLVAVAIPAIIASIIYILGVWFGNFGERLKGGFGIRLLNAITIGAAEALLPVYLGEISRSMFRGIFCISVALWSQLGVILVDLLLHADDRLPMQVFVVLGCVVLILYTIVVPFIPKSPYYIATARSEETKVRNSMIGLLGSVKDEEVKEVVEHTAKAQDYASRSCRLFSDSGCLRAFWILLLLAVCSELTGASVAYFMEYSLEPIPELGGKDSHVIISLTKFGGIVLVMALIDLVGRRIMLLVSGNMATLSIVAVALILAFKESMNNDIQNSSTYISVLLVVYILFMSIGVRTVPLVLVPELFPTGERLIASGLFVVIKQVLFFAITVVHHTYIRKNINYIVFAAYAVILVVCSNVVVYLLPETKRQSFLQIEASLRKKKDGDATDAQDTAVQKPDGPAPQEEQSGSSDPKTEQSDSADPKNEQSDSPDTQNEQSDSPNAQNQPTDGLSVSFGSEGSVKIGS